MPVFISFQLIIQRLLKHFRFLLMYAFWYVVFGFLFLVPLKEFYSFQEGYTLPASLQYYISESIAPVTLLVNGVWESISIISIAILCILFLFIESFMKGGFYAVFASSGQDINNLSFFKSSLKHFNRFLFVRLLFFLLTAAFAIIFYDKILSIIATKTSILPYLVGITSVLLLFGWIYSKVTEAATVIYHQYNIFKILMLAFKLCWKYRNSIFVAFFYVALVSLFLAIFTLNFVATKDWFHSIPVKVVYFLMGFIILRTLLTSFSGLLYFIAGTHQVESSYHLSPSFRAYMKVLPKEDY